MNDAAILIRTEIDKRGVISFAHFMALALYAPSAGYYENQGRVGRAGDFYTSTSTGPLFGELLGFQFAQWMLERQESQIVECGANDGQLAGDMLGYLEEFWPELFVKMEYWILEPSTRRREWQGEKLADYSGRVHWIGEWSDVKEGEVRGVIFGNELMDAFPVHRLGWDKVASVWFEWGVGFSGGEFVWARMEKPALKALRNGTFQVPSALREHLPDGFVTVSSPEAANWWHEAAKKLGSGQLLAVDYGLEAEEFFAPDRLEGTLRTYSQHQVLAEPLANPGGQDITASVNFSVLRTMGELAGLRTTPMVTQEKFLMSVFEKTLNKPDKFPEWTEKRRREFQTLVHPEHLGRPFKILMQLRI